MVYRLKLGEGVCTNETQKLFESDAGRGRRSCPSRRRARGKGE